MYSLPFDVPIEKVKNRDYFVVNNIWWEVFRIVEKDDKFILYLQSYFHGSSPFHVPKGKIVRIKRWVGY